MAERYSVTDVEGLAAHLATVLARHAEGHATANSVADAALGWAADHGFVRADPAGHTIPDLAGFTRRAGIPISDLDDCAETAIALGHWPEADVAAAFAEHAHVQWGDDTKRPTRIRRGWVVNAGNDTDWCLVPSSADVAAAFRVTYWEY
jgi:hypothetical protein